MNKHAESAKILLFFSEYDTFDPNFVFESLLFFLFYTLHMPK